LHPTFLKIKTTALFVNHFNDKYLRFYKAYTSLMKFSMFSQKRALLLAICWTLGILLACLIPGNEVPDIHIPLADKWVHFIIFAGFSFLWLSTFKYANTAKGVLIFILAVLLGYAVELLQDSGITTGRSYDVYDIVADGIGGILGVVLFFLWRRAAFRAP
jgi:VanZ family protein